MKNRYQIESCKIKNILLLSIYLLSYSSCFSQSVIIKGKVDTSYLSQATAIYAYTYDDYISFKEKELGNNPFDTGRNFSLSFSVSEPTYIFLMVDNAKAEMVVEPNKTYDINFLAKDSNAVNTLSSAIPVEIEFNNSEPIELNYLMADFTERYEAFLEYHRPLITKKNPAIFGKIDTMKALCLQKYSLYEKPYLDNYIYYTFALLEEGITLKEKGKIFQEYLSFKPISLNNHDYMAFFNSFFSATASHFMTTEKMLSEINSKQNFSSLMEYFKQNKFLANDTIRETILLKSLAEYFRYPAYKTNAVLSILEQAAKECKAEANRRAAENLKKKLSVMNIGKPVPSIVFSDKDGKTVTLLDFKGKYIYLNFWASWCSSCTQEMMLIPELKKSYGGKIVFVSISVDKKMETMNNFLKKNPKLDPAKNGAGWVFLHCNNYKQVKEEFNVLTVPSYCLIDPKGNIFQFPAGNPIDIEPILMEIKKKK